MRFIILALLSIFINFFISAAYTYPTSLIGFKTSKEVCVNSNKPNNTLESSPTPPTSKVFSLEVGSNPRAESLRLVNLFNLGFQKTALDETIKYLKIYPLSKSLRQVLVEYYTQEKKHNFLLQQVGFIELWNTWQNGDRLLAITEALTLQKKYPDNPEFTYSLGQFYFYKKDYALAEREFKRALQKDPDFLAAATALIELYITTQNNYEALNIYNDKLKFNEILFSKEKQLIMHAQNTYYKDAATDFSEFIYLWRLWDNGYQTQAIDEALVFLKSHPNEVQIQLSLGQFYLLRKNATLARQEIWQILGKRPNYTLALISLIDAYTSINNFEAAQNLLALGLALSPINPLLLEKKGFLEKAKNTSLQGSALSTAEYNFIWSTWSRGHKLEAIKATEDFLKKYPDDSRIALSLSQFYQKQKQYKQAILLATSILDKNPTYIGARTTLSNIYLETQNFHMAEQVIDIGLGLLPENSEFLSQKKNIALFREFAALWQLWNENNRDEAIQRAQYYLNHFAYSNQIDLSLGQFYFLKKEYNLALEHINKILTHDPDYVDARLSLIDVYIAMKNYKEATDILNKGLILSPQDTQLLDKIKAIEIAKNPSLAKRYPSNLEEFNRIWHLWKVGKKKDALKQATLFLQKNPNDEVLSLSIGQFYFLLKNYPLAIKQIDPLLTKDPAYVAARTTLIDIYLATKNYKKATAILNQGLTIAPKNLSLLAYKQTIVKAQLGQSLAFSPAKPAPPALLWSHVEWGGMYAKLTSDYGTWVNAYLTGVFKTDVDNSWQAIILHGSEFQQKADYGLVQKTHNFNDTWFGTLGAGISDNSIWVPTYYVGGNLSRRFFKSKKLIAYLGAQYYTFRPIYSLEVLNPGLIYYFKKPWIIETGVYLNRSNPGGVDTAVGYIAVTQGRDQEHFITLRGAWGREGYLPITNTANNLVAGIYNSPILGFPSIVFTGTWRQWVGKHWGFNLVGEYYHNTYFERYGTTFGIFKEFSL